MFSIPGLVSHYFSLEDALAAATPVSYVFGSNGIMTIHRTNFGRLGVLGASKDIPGLEPLPSYLIEWSIPQIPFDLFVSAVSTLKAAYASYQAESLIFICYDGQNYFLYVPEQEVTSASVNYELDIPSEHIVMHIHSHPGSMDRFSGTDDRDETNAGFYVVLSNLTASWPTVTLSLCVGQNRVTLSSSSDLAQVFSIPASMEPRLDMLSKIRPKTLYTSSAHTRYRPSYVSAERWNLYDDWDDHTLGDPYAYRRSNLPSSKEEL